MPLMRAFVRLSFQEMTTQPHPRVRGTLAEAAEEPPPRPEGVLIELEAPHRPSGCSGLRWGRLAIAPGLLLPPETAPAAPKGRLALLAAPGPRVRLTDEQGVLGGRVVAAWRCPAVAAAAAHLAARGWVFSGCDLALFLVILVEEGPPLTLMQIENMLRLVLEGGVAVPKRGEPVLLEATPFSAGNMFLNSWSSGIVSSVSGAADSLVLSDAHAAPGSEGGALYAVRKGGRRPVAVVVQTVVQVRGEAVALCLAVSLPSILTSALALKPTPPSTPEDENLNRGVVLLRDGDTWASAVTIDAQKGVFLTCSHVLKRDIGDSVQLQWGPEPVRAKILFKSPPSSAFDVAVLKTQVPRPKFAPQICPNLPKKGDVVEVVGFGLLPPPEAAGEAPCAVASRGLVSQARPHMLQTCCAVQSGHSGGGVLLGGRLVGLVVGHTQTPKEARLPAENWPRINFALPLAAIAKPLAAFLDTQGTFINFYTLLLNLYNGKNLMS
ncbi:Hypothetical predicted protein [Cloeon dipterum]|uniref:Peroxisomal leader peptide-processing protease n=1 Tax=Cloeon dipterum TaxID=197152 RepID=A0A8S1D4D2_9INSE|nr:Hypothetical predicted protein [Cloeon dipterum]